MIDNEHSSTTSETLFDKDLVENYVYLIQKFTTGPQAEGLSEQEIEAAIRSPKTEYINLEVENRQINLPLFVDLNIARWINVEFFQSQDKNNFNNIYYCCIPQKLLGIIGNENIDKKIDEMQTKYGHFNILFDYPENVQPVFRKEIDDLITPDKTPAAIYHYEFVAQETNVKNEEIDSHVTLLESDGINENFDRIWEIYNRQFQKLVDDHPIAGAFSYDELKMSLLDSSTKLMVYFDESNIIQSFGYYIDDIQKCPWLNKDYYNDSSETILYMPGIASDPEFSKPVGGVIMKALFKYAITKHKSAKIIFECSNKSSKYIPKITRRMLERQHFATFSELEEFKHYYKLAKF